MADIDVSDLLGDPDFIDTFTVLRRQETTNNSGESTLAITTYPTPPDLPQPYGAVFPTGDNKLVRQQDFTTQSSTITVITQFRLRGSSKSGGSEFQPDIVVWNGGNYVVSNVNEYTQYGAGFIEAECTSIDFTPPAPV
jgi:hypothetical protein